MSTMTKSLPWQKVVGAMERNAAGTRCWEGTVRFGLAEKMVLKEIQISEGQGAQTKPSARESACRTE